MPIAVRNLLISFFLSLVIFGAIAFLLSTNVVGNFDPFSGQQGNPDETTDTGTGDEPTDPGVIKGDSFNVLLIGTDYQPDILHDYNPDIAVMYPKFKRFTLDPNSSAGFNSIRYRRISPDTIIMMRISKENQAFMFTAIPPNMLVDAGGAQTTIGELYQDEGFDYFCSMIHAVTGLSVDYHVVADIKGLAKAIDLINGITYTVPVDMHYTDPVQNLHISLKAGTKRLNGDQALQLLRYNNYTTGVHSRLKTGVSFLRAIIAKMTNVVYMNRIFTMYEEISPYFDTNFTLNDLKNHYELIFKYAEFSTSEIIYPGSYKEIQGVTYFNPNIQQAIANYSAYR